MSSRIPLLVEFVSGTRLFRELDLIGSLPVLHNGPPGTFVIFSAGLRVSLPTDQIVYAEETSTGVRIGFGGMRFAGAEGTQLIFHRVREMHPEEQLSPARSRTMFLDARWVSSVVVDGREAWTQPTRPAH